MKSVLALVMIFVPCAWACISIPESIELEGATFSSLPITVSDDGTITIDGDRMFYNQIKKTWCLVDDADGELQCNLREGEVVTLDDESAKPKKLIGKMIVSNASRSLVIQSVNTVTGEIDKDKPYMRVLDEGAVKGPSLATKLTVEAFEKVGGSKVGDLVAAGDYYVDPISGEISSKFRSLSNERPSDKRNLKGKSIVVGGCTGSSSIKPFAATKKPAFKVNGQTQTSDATITK